MSEGLQTTVIHVVPDLRQKAGGISATVPALARALLSQGVRSRFITYEHDSKFLWAREAYRAPHSITQGPIKLARLIESVFADLPTGTPTVLHSHGLWDMLNHGAIRAAIRGGRPTLVSLHGMLLPWARRHKKLRKDIAWRVYQRRDLTQASAVHVTSQAEADTVAGVLPSHRIHTIPFGISFSQSAPVPRSVSETRNLLFLGRMHPVKNLETLIRSFVSAAPANCHLHLVGPDEENHKATLLALVSKLNAGEHISIRGPVFGMAKDTTIADADGVVLPSFTENFGSVVAEALAMGRPVISSTGTPWEALHRERCGWWVDPDAGSLSRAITAFCNAPRHELRAMGERGRAYVRRSFNQTTSAESMGKVYTSLLSTQISPISRS